MTDPTQPQDQHPQNDNDGPSDNDIEQAAEPRSFERDPFGKSATDDGETQPEASGSGASADDVEEECDPRQEALLDEGVEETFPASDPVSVKHIT